MNKDSIQFLKDLQHKMLTQDSMGQADPRFWVIRQKVREYGIDIDYNNYNGEILVDDNNEIIAENLNDLYTFLKEREEDNDFVVYKMDGYLEICKNSFDINYWIYNLTDFNDIADEIGLDCVYIIYYKEEYKIVENTLFLTLEECENHIKNNSYHYNKPVAYCMTAWRSPQVEKLYEILKNTNWEDVNCI